MLPCPDPELHETVYEKVSKKHVLLSDWNMTTAGAQGLKLPPTQTPELWKELKTLETNRVALMRRLAQHLIRLQPATEQRVKDRIQAAGVDVSRPFVSMHFRRGDKARETTSNTITSASMVNRVEALSSTFEWVFVLTDDARAVEDLRLAAPHWKLVSFADPSSVGFNECMLPSVRAIRQGACGNMCKNLTEAAFGKFKRRSYCFMNPAEPDNAKLIPVPMDNDASIQAEAAFGMIVDVWLASRSVLHFSGGCGSNVDKLINVLRTAPENTTVCYDSAQSDAHQCNGRKCGARRCSLNPDNGVLGFECVDETFEI
jgi:hypothetical protein